MIREVAAGGAPSHRWKGDLLIKAQKEGRCEKQ